MSAECPFNERGKDIEYSEQNHTDQDCLANILPAVGQMHILDSSDASALLPSGNQLQKQEQDQSRRSSADDHDECTHLAGLPRQPLGCRGIGELKRQIRVRTHIHAKERGNEGEQRREIEAGVFCRDSRLINGERAGGKELRLQQDRHKRYQQANGRQEGQRRKRQVPVACPAVSGINWLCVRVTLS